MYQEQAFSLSESSSINWPTFNPTDSTSFNSPERDSFSNFSWSCVHCDYKAYNKKDVIKHMRKHTGEKPFSCIHCGYKTTQSSNLYKHIRMKHKILHY